MNANYTLAAFISAGMHRDVAKLDEARDAAGTGCLELIQSAMEYVDYVNNLCLAGLAVAGGYPGVVEYEICEDFGQWYVECTLEDEAVPNVTDACVCLVNLTTAFFRLSAADLPRLSANLTKVPMPAQPVL